MLPFEITDAIIDHLQTDIPALGVCSLVCSEWLVRSRHHIFSTVQLLPWRARTFFDLGSSLGCTFVNYVRRIEVDDSRLVRSEGGKESGREEGGDEIMIFRDVMSQTHIPGAAGVRSLQIRHVDWTTLTQLQQACLRDGFKKFSFLDQLELDGTVFHDLREVKRILAALPTLRRLTANLAFLKYSEYNLDSAMATHLGSPLVSLELGTDDAIAVLLTSLSGWDGLKSINVLRLRSVKQKYLQYVSGALQKFGDNLQELSVRFYDEEASEASNGKRIASSLIGFLMPTIGDFLAPLDFGSLSKIRTVEMENLTLTSPMIRKSLPTLLENLESSFFETLNLHFLLSAEQSVGSMDLHRLEKVLLSLHFFGMKAANIILEVQSGVTASTATDEEMEVSIRSRMSDLHARGALNVNAKCKLADHREESIRTKS